MIAANHASHFEPLLIPWLLPGNVHTLAMAELFHGPVRRRFWHLMLAIPVDRQRLEPRAIRDAVRRLDAGRQILLFPEGGIRFGHQALVRRSGPLAIGAASIAVIAQVPLYPLLLTGGRAGYQRRAWIRGHAPIGVFFGRPLATTPRAGERRGDTISRVNAALLEALNELVRRARADAAPAARPLSAPCPLPCDDDHPVRHSATPQVPPHKR